MQANTDHIQSTHVGSLARPDALREVLRKRHEGEPYDEAEYHRLSKQAVNDIVRMQVKAGIDIVCDGEMSKVSYTSYVKHRFEGMSSGSGKQDRTTYPQQLTPPPDYREHPDFAAWRARTFGGPGAVTPPVCTGPIRYVDTAPVLEDIANLKAAGKRAKAPKLFMNAASPGVLAVFIPNVHYKTEDAYIADLADAMATEYEAITKAGIILQLDAPDVALSRHMRYGDQDDRTFLKTVARNVEAINHATRNCPPELLRLHICWGNYGGPHTHDFPVAKLIRPLMKLRPRAFQFEGANPRHEHEWEDWKDAKLDDDVILIPGVVDSTNNFVEHPRLVAQRLLHYTDIVGRERVIAGSDCGFATWSPLDYQVQPTIAMAKLKATADGAALATKELWKRRAAAKKTAVAKKPAAKKSAARKGKAA
jgi:5-methyltetrahydropteroyltriglutamate--homocysteine methyltransferase